MAESKAVKMFGRGRRRTVNGRRSFECVKRFDRCGGVRNNLFASLVSKKRFVAKRERERERVMSALYVPWRSFAFSSSSLDDAGKVLCTRVIEAMQSTCSSLTIARFRHLLTFLVSGCRPRQSGRVSRALTPRMRSISISGNANRAELEPNSSRSRPTAEPKPIRSVSRLLFTLMSSRSFEWRRSSVTAHAM
jgi:hypothetical protein